MAPRAGLYGGAHAGEDGPYKSRIPPPNTIARRARDEDIRGPCSQIVDCGDEALVGGGGVVEGDDPARGDIDAGDDANVVAG